MPRVLYPLLLTLMSACGGEVDTGLPTGAETRITISRPTTLEEPAPPVEQSLIEEPSEEPPMLATGESPPGEPEEEVETFTLKVRPNENLVLLARWAGTSVETLAELNDIQVGAPLTVSQTLRVPFTVSGGPESIEASRIAWIAGRVDRYAQARGGVIGVIEHPVRTGETASGIAREQGGLPTFVLAAYNEGVDLSHLGVGEVLLVPVFNGDVGSDTLAEGDEPTGEESGETTRPVTGEALTLVE